VLNHQQVEILEQALVLVVVLVLELVFQMQHLLIEEVIQMIG